MVNVMTRSEWRRYWEVVLSLLVAVSVIPIGRYNAIHSSDQCNRGGTPLQLWGVPAVGLVLGVAMYLFLHAVGVPNRYRKPAALVVGAVAALAWFAVHLVSVAGACAS
jgi:hypothetical protein